MFVEASAILAMMTNEDDAVTLATQLQRHKVRTTSPAEVTNSSIQVASTFGISVVDATGYVSEFLKLMSINVVPMPHKTSVIAAEIYDNYGNDKHPAALDISQCMSIASAKYLRYPLLFKDHKLTLYDLSQN